MKAAIPLDVARRHLAAELCRSLQENDGLTPCEADEALNEASRHVIAAMFESYGECWIGRVNLRGPARGSEEHILRAWDGEQVCNFDADFIMPRLDKPLVALILARDRTPYTGTRDDLRRYQVIMARIRDGGGVMLHWA